MQAGARPDTGMQRSMAHHEENEHGPERVVLCAQAAQWSAMCKQEVATNARNITWRVKGASWYVASSQTKCTLIS